MRLVSVLCSRGLANAQTYPPVRTFECAACEKDMIWQGQLAPPDHNHIGQPTTLGATPPETQASPLTPPTAPATAALARDTTDRTPRGRDAALFERRGDARQARYAGGP
jgi:hypothetical protein